VLLDDDLSKLAPAIGVAGKTRGIVTQNIVFALGVKLLFMTGGVAGVAGLWEAVFADVGVMVLAVLNSLRARRAG
jgi:Cd2+/Zn2+-exporting ATPase